MRLFRGKGQSTAEYAILIALVVGALVGMQIYVKRGLQGRMKDASDKYTTNFDGSDESTATDWNIINETTATLSPHYEFEGYASQRSRTSDSSTTETMNTGGTIARDINESTSQQVGDYTEYAY